MSRARASLHSPRRGGDGSPDLEALGAREQAWRRPTRRGRRWGRGGRGGGWGGLRWGRRVGSAPGGGGFVPVVLELDAEIVGSAEKRRGRRAPAEIGGWSVHL